MSHRLVNGMQGVKGSNPLSSTRRASPALRRASTGRIPRSPCLSFGPVATGLVLVVEVVLVGPTITPPPKPHPHRLDPVQHARPSSHAHSPPCQTQQQEKHQT